MPARGTRRSGCCLVTRAPRVSARTRGRSASARPSRRGDTGVRQSGECLAVVRGRVRRPVAHGEVVLPHVEGPALPPAHRQGPASAFSHDSKPCSRLPWRAEAAYAWQGMHELLPPAMCQLQVPGSHCRDARPRQHCLPGPGPRPAAAGAAHSRMLRRAVNSARSSRTPVPISA
jgi:hypothetical protein